MPKTTQKIKDSAYGGPVRTRNAGRCEYRPDPNAIVMFVIFGFLALCGFDAMFCRGYDRRTFRQRPERAAEILSNVVKRAWRQRGADSGSALPVRQIRAVVRPASAAGR
jgi:hypothetical protein